MIKYLRIFLLLLVIQLIFGVHPVFATTYVVRPYIIVLNTWNDKVTPQDLEHYKANIRKALGQVQQWYVGALNGKTFNIDNQEIKVDYPTKTPRLEKYGTTFDLIKDIYGLLGEHDLNFSSIIRPESGVVKIVFIIGSSNLLATGGPLKNGVDFITTGDIEEGGNSKGAAFINHVYLEDLDKPADDKAHKFALKAIAHELGHTFGAIFTDHVNGHPCTVASPNQCKPGAPFPRPTEIEWTQSVMGYGSAALEGNVSFNNSKYNPEKFILFKSLFLNPQKTTPPPPQESVQPKIKFRITSITPEVAKAGETMTIFGEGFGETPGLVKLYPLSGGEYYQPQIKTWSDTRIDIQIGNNIAPNTAISHTVKVLTKEAATNPCREYDGNLSACDANGQACGYFICSKQCWPKGTDLETGCAGFDKNTSGQTASFEGTVTIIGLDKPKPPQFDFTFNFTCGPQKNPSSGGALIATMDPFMIVLAVSANSNGQANASADLDENRMGKNQIGKKLVIRPDPLIDGSGGSVQAENSEILVDIKPEITSQKIDIHYPTCLNQQTPAQATPITTQTTTPTINNTEPDNLPVQFTTFNKTERIIISSGGEEPVIIEDMETDQKVIMELNADEQQQKVQITEEYTDGTIKNYEADLEDNQQTAIGNVTVEAKVIKRVKQIYMFSSSDPENKIFLYTTEEGYQNPEIEAKNDLNLYKIITIYSDETSEEDSLFYIEKSKNELPPIQDQPTQQENIIGSCEGNLFDCATQDQVCEEFTNNEGKQDTHCVNLTQEGQ